MARIRRLSSTDWGSGIESTGLFVCGSRETRRPRPSPAGALCATAANDSRKRTPVSISPSRGLLESGRLGCCRSGRRRRWRDMRWHGLYGNSLGRRLVDQRLWPPRLIRENFLHCLEHALRPSAAKLTSAVGESKTPSEQGFLQLGASPTRALQCCPGQQMHHVHRMRLAQTVDSSDPLLQAGGVPGGLEIDHRRGRLEIQANASRVRGEKHAALRIAPEFLHERAAILGRHAAVQRDESDSQLLPVPLPPGESSAHTR
jgi:hypothetical protein